MDHSSRISPEDEYTHEPSDDPQFNESMYFNFVDGDEGFAALIRMGNRVNEGHAEVTVLLYLPDGGAALHFERAPIAHNRTFDAGGLRFDVADPLKRVDVRYDGAAHLLASGRELEDPKQALGTNPERPLRLHLGYDTAIPLYGLGEDDDSGIAGAEEQIATGHYQGACRVTGEIELDGQTRRVSGLGFRDHSWGPRRWHGPRWWRWVSCLCDEDNGFVGWLARMGDNRPAGRGMVLRDGVFSRVRDVELDSDYEAQRPHYPTGMRLVLHTDEGRWEASGRATSLVPLRHRREGQTARLAELVCAYEFQGRTGYGISEYHDLMTDGVPAGMEEA